MLISSCIITLVYFAPTGDYSILRIIWETTIYSFIGSILYVLVGWKLYNRVDNLLDRKVGSDIENDKSVDVKEIKEKE